MIGLPFDQCRLAEWDTPYTLFPTIFVDATLVIDEVLDRARENRLEEDVVGDAGDGVLLSDFFLTKRKCVTKAYNNKRITRYYSPWTVRCTVRGSFHKILHGAYDGTKLVRFLDEDSMLDRELQQEVAPPVEDRLTNDHIARIDVQTRPARPRSSPLIRDGSN